MASVGIIGAAGFTGAELLRLCAAHPDRDVVGATGDTQAGTAVADLTAPHIILATGARARTLPGLEPDGKLVWTYKEAMVPAAMPSS